MRVVVLESPYAGNVERNVDYARVAMLDALHKLDAPFVGHLLYTQVLDDRDPAQRARGIAAHCAFISRADALVVYTDLGLSEGMKMAIEVAAKHKVPIERRSLEGWRIEP